MSLPEIEAHPQIVGTDLDQRFEHIDETARTGGGQGPHALARMNVCELLKDLHAGRARHGLGRNGGQQIHAWGAQVVLITDRIDEHVRIED